VFFARENHHKFNHDLPRIHHKFTTKTPRFAHHFSQNPQQKHPSTTPEKNMTKLSPSPRAGKNHQPPYPCKLK
jgi:hypothetical protein